MTYRRIFLQQSRFPQTDSVDSILMSRSEFPWLSAWPSITHHFNISLTSSGEKQGCDPAIPPDWDIVKVHKSCTVRGSSIMYAPNIPGISIALGASKSALFVASLLIGAQNIFMFSRNLKFISKSALALPPFFVFHSHQFPSKIIGAGVENFPRYPRT